MKAEKDVFIIGSELYKELLEFLQNPGTKIFFNDTRRLNFICNKLNPEKYVLTNELFTYACKNANGEAAIEYQGYINDLMETTIAAIREVGYSDLEGDIKNDAIEKIMAFLGDFDIKNNHFFDNIVGHAAIYKPAPDLFAKIKGEITKHAKIALINIKFQSYDDKLTKLEMMLNEKKELEEALNSTQIRGVMNANDDNARSIKELEQEIHALVPSIMSQIRLHKQEAEEKFASQERLVQLESLLSQHELQLQNYVTNNELNNQLRMFASGINNRIDLQERGINSLASNLQNVENKQSIQAIEIDQKASKEDLRLLQNNILSFRDALKLNDGTFLDIQKKISTIQSSNFIDQEQLLLAQESIADMLIGMINDAKDEMNQKYNNAINSEEKDAINMKLFRLERELKNYYANNEFTLAELNQSIANIKDAFSNHDIQLKKHDDEIEELQGEQREFKKLLRQNNKRAEYIEEIQKNQYEEQQDFQKLVSEKFEEQQSQNQGLFGKLRNKLKKFKANTNKEITQQNAQISANTQNISELQKLQELNQSQNEKFKTKFGKLKIFKKDVNEKLKQQQNLITQNQKDILQVQAEQQGTKDILIQQEKRQMTIEKSFDRFNKVINVQLNGLQKDLELEIEKHKQDSALVQELKDKQEKLKLIISSKVNKNEIEEIKKEMHDYISILQSENQSQINKLKSDMNKNLVERDSALTKKFQQVLTEQLNKQSEVLEQNFASKEALRNFEEHTKKEFLQRYHEQVKQITEIANQGNVSAQEISVLRNGLANVEKNIAHFGEDAEYNKKNIEILSCKLQEQSEIAAKYREALDLKANKEDLIALNQELREQMLGNVSNIKDAMTGLRSEIKQEITQVQKQFSGKLKKLKSETNQKIQEQNIRINQNNNQIIKHENKINHLNDGMIKNQLEIQQIQGVQNDVIHDLNKQQNKIMELQNELEREKIAAQAMQEEQKRRLEEKEKERQEKERQIIETQTQAQAKIDAFDLELNNMAREQDQNKQNNVLLMTLQLAKLQAEAQYGSIEKLRLEQDILLRKEQEIAREEKRRQDEIIHAKEEALKQERQKAEQQINEAKIAKRQEQVLAFSYQGSAQKTVDHNARKFVQYTQDDQVNKVIEKIAPQVNTKSKTQNDLDSAYISNLRKIACTAFNVFHIHDISSIVGSGIATINASSGNSRELYNITITVLKDTLAAFGIKDGFDWFNESVIAAIARDSNISNEALINKYNEYVEKQKLEIIDSVKKKRTVKDGETMFETLAKQKRVFPNDGKTNDNIIIEQGFRDEILGHLKKDGDQNSIISIAPAGSGKTTTINELLAYFGKHNLLYDKDLNYEIIDISWSELKGPGGQLKGNNELVAAEFSEYIKFLINTGKKPYFLIDEFHIGFSDDDANALLQAIKPLMTTDSKRPPLGFIGMTTENEYEKFIAAKLQQDAALQRRFGQPVVMPLLSRKAISEKMIEEIENICPMSKKESQSLFKSIALICDIFRMDVRPNSYKLVIAKLAQYYQAQSGISDFLLQYRNKKAALSEAKKKYDNSNGSKKIILTKFYESVKKDFDDFSASIIRSNKLAIPNTNDILNVLFGKDFSKNVHEIEFPSEMLFKLREVKADYGVLEKILNSGCYEFDVNNTDDQKVEKVRASIKEKFLANMKSETQKQNELQEIQKQEDNIKIQKEKEEEKEFKNSLIDAIKQVGGNYTDNTRIQMEKYTTMEQLMTKLIEMVEKSSNKHSFPPELITTLENISRYSGVTGSSSAGMKSIISKIRKQRDTNLIELVERQQRNAGNQNVINKRPVSPVVRQVNQLKKNNQTQQKKIQANKQEQNILHGSTITKSRNMVQMSPTSNKKQSITVPKQDSISTNIQDQQHNQLDSYINIHLRTINGIQSTAIDKVQGIIKSLIESCRSNPIKLIQCQDAFSYLPVKYQSELNAAIMWTDRAKNSVSELLYNFLVENKCAIVPKVNNYTNNSIYQNNNEGKGGRMQSNGDRFAQKAQNPRSKSH